MLRLVVIHQLVLSLVVGPMLCCCAGARLVRDNKPDAQVSAERPLSSPCCGHGQKSPDGGGHKPGGQPGDPAKCPCKDAPAKTTAIPETTAGSADSLSLLSSGTAALDLPVLLDLQPGPARPAARFDHRSASLSAADLLYAHHNLRC